ncbi:M23 family metallopeptidase [Streptomyces dubilierae]|uniref:Peptidoglycan DD-metalloendopeptidase family protein n=1 Tax=Streptomyces dubilierae TaxID=3075533 RepID=A0ABU2PHD8_9ACTN|nr:peptidoglycan DD-metalloendopeptidase family protein [Streptomyces sp. DSM 41921]MDT0391573.1 peptidoglycan DD-metalloendopeptidase family protein [Streptomyces sp. DSM 41921]
MPAKGKHRRPKTQRFTRSIAVAGTGGAALALPLMGAAGAHAATPQSAPEKAVQAAPAAGKKAAEKATGARTYTVRAGDYLAKIADDQNVSGGWKKLYSDNRDAVGDDPSLIHPGLKLSLGKKAAASPSEAPSAPKAPAEKPAGSTETTKSSSGSSAEAEAPAKPAAAKPAAQSNASGYSSPVDGATVGTPYRMSGSMWSSGYHTGVDFVVPTGTSLKAVGAGTVVSAGWGGAYGNQVVVKLNDGHYAQYAHLSQLSVTAGQTVSAGQQVGLSGATGNVTGPHLHFEIRTAPGYGSDVDPVAFLRSHGVSVG